MIVNETKHQAMILGDTEYTFSFPVKESIDIFGMNIENKLQFDKHVSSVCKKINNQLNVMIRFRNQYPNQNICNLTVNVWESVLQLPVDILGVIQREPENYGFHKQNLGYFRFEV